MRRAALLALALMCLPGATPPLAGQSLSDVFNQLFVFGGNQELFLTGSAGFDQTEVHGDHFIPSEVEGNGALLGFFTNAISVNIASVPLPSTVSSQTYRFINGVPTPTSTSFGPISAERAQTLGRGRVNVGFNLSDASFSTIRGVSLDQVELNFVHSNVNFPGCDQVFGGSCEEFGTPTFENDIIGLDLNLDLDAQVYTLFTTVGLTDFLDLSVVVPIVSLSLRGSSVARISPSQVDDINHFFGGTPENPVLEARSQAFGDATGLGDVAVRAKAHVSHSENFDVAVLGELRAPTGREEDFLGTGSVNAKGVLILSGSYDRLSPHVNLGYEHRGSDLDPDEIELAIGFDQLVTSWASLAVDLLGAFKLDESGIQFPDPVEIPAPFARTVERTNIPDRRDDIVDAAIGFKFRTGAGLVVVTNALVALNEGGLRSRVTGTLGVEYAF